MGEDGAGSDDYDPNADPKADPRERRRIRYEYRELIAETQKNRHDFIKPESTGLHQALDKADDLFKGVRLTREAVLDSHFLVLASNLGSQQAQQLQTHLVTFDPDTFVQKLITFMGGRNIADASREDDEDEDMPSRRQHPPPRLDWKKLGQKASVAFRRTPNVDFMLGPLSMEPPRRATRDTQKKPQQPKPTVLVKPTQATEIGINFQQFEVTYMYTVQCIVLLLLGLGKCQLEKVESREEATTKEVERLHKVLYENTVTENGEVNPVCLFKFIINPHSFGQTIENLFHLSFLVRDGRADISLEDGLPVVSYEEMGGENEETIKKQVVVHLTLQEYEEIIRTFNITEPMIPPRPRMNHVNSAGTTNRRNQNDNDDDEEEEDEDN